MSQPPLACSKWILGQVVSNSVNLIFIVYSFIQKLLTWQMIFFVKMGPNDQGQVKIRMNRLMLSNVIAAGCAGSDSIKSW